ncbi:hypothetical protein R3P38DRAFT_3195190 [Favolaschia claudopus]|uniref:Uncharacterized protein n=1 Tax=Favolaschia claudopus TaxID=2862362 RepID=A0AAW0BBV0_9AGAR
MRLLQSSLVFLCAAAVAVSAQRGPPGWKRGAPGWKRVVTSRLRKLQEVDQPLVKKEIAAAPEAIARAVPPQARAVVDTGCN